MFEAAMVLPMAWDTAGRASPPKASRAPGAAEVDQRPDLAGTEYHLPNARKSPPSVSLK
jgi:hypothetical protein